MVCPDSVCVSFSLWICVHHKYVCDHLCVCACIFTLGGNKRNCVSTGSIRHYSPQSMRLFNWIGTRPEVRWRNSHSAALCKEKVREEYVQQKGRKEHYCQTPQGNNEKTRLNCESFACSLKRLLLLMNECKVIHQRFCFLTILAFSLSIFQLVAFILFFKSFGCTQIFRGLRVFQNTIRSILLLWKKGSLSVLKSWPN